MVKEKPFDECGNFKIFAIKITFISKWFSFIVLIYIDINKMNMFEFGSIKSDLFIYLFLFYLKSNMHTFCCLMSIGFAINI